MQKSDAHQHGLQTINTSFTLYITGPSQLTLKALANHDAKTSGLPGQDDDSNMDTQSMASFGAKTFQTFATNFTNCTNATFRKVPRQLGTMNNSNMQKEVRRQTDWWEWILEVVVY
jgi:hypothetical protein